jgi:probable phosphoglycerate mutase
MASPRLRERNTAWEGLTSAEIQARYPEQFAIWRARTTDFAPRRDRNELLTRALAGLQAIARARKGDGGRGDPWWALLCPINHILGSVDGDQREFTFGNASIHTLEVTGDHWSVISMNEIAHLQVIEC